MICFNQISQQELAKAQQTHADVNLEAEVGFRTRMDDLHRELSEVRVSVKYRRTTTATTNNKKRHSNQ